MTAKADYRKESGESEGTFRSARDLGGQVKSTLKEIVSVLKGYYQGGERPCDRAT